MKKDKYDWIVTVIAFFIITNLVVINILLLIKLGNWLFPVEGLDY